jgi:hypothetical protein
MVEEYKNGKVVGKMRGTLFGAEGKETASRIRTYTKHMPINPYPANVENRVSS